MSYSHCSTTWTWPNLSTLMLPPAKFWWSSRVCYVLPSCQILMLWKLLWYNALPSPSPRFAKFYPSSHQLCELIFHIDLTLKDTIHSLENKKNQILLFFCFMPMVETHFSAWDLSSTTSGLQFQSLGSHAGNDPIGCSTESGGARSFSTATEEVFSW